ncbi:DUF4145 domain-containing protein [Paractinoplanes maris]|uniref:DUF4145 domain-containing protein n=1 Tax=Paractinoplanes maris TaxID=1734446 RepID=UPI0034DB7529
MISNSSLRPSTAEMAHEIRFWGNNVAHGDFADPVSAEEAEGVLTLMDEVLQEVFQAPARLAKVRALRQQSGDSSSSAASPPAP